MSLDVQRPAGTRIGPNATAFVGLADVFVKPHTSGGHQVKGFYRKSISLGGGKHFQLNETPISSKAETPRFGDYNFEGQLHHGGQGGVMWSRSTGHHASTTTARPGEFPGNPAYRVQVDNLGQHGVPREGIGHFNVYESGHVKAVDPKTGKPTKLAPAAHAIGSHLAYVAAHAHKRGALPGTSGVRPFQGP